MQFTIPTHAALRAVPSTRGDHVSVVPRQIEKITLSRSHFDGRRHGDGNEDEGLEIDVTAVTRNDSRFVASSRFIARKKKWEEQTSFARGPPVKMNASVPKHAGRKQDGLIARDGPVRHNYKRDCCPRLKNVEKHGDCRDEK